jgi:hypothetical protein
MRVIVERHIEYREGPLCWAIGPEGGRPQLLPKRIRDHVVANGAGRLVENHGHRDGGIAAVIARRRAR